MYVNVGNYYACIKNLEFLYVFKHIIFFMEIIYSYYDYFTILVCLL